MSQLTEEQIEEVVSAIQEYLSEGLDNLNYLGDGIKAYELEHHFTEEQMNTFYECQLIYGIKENYEEEDDEEEDKEELYTIERNYPWSSGSWFEDEESLDKSLEEEITNVIKRVIENVK